MKSSANLPAILEVLLDAVLCGGVEVLQARQQQTVEASYKDAKELVTTADRSSDAAILSVFRKRLPSIDPDISFRLEESGSHGATGTKWVGADPIDGTNHFAAGGTLYSVQAHYVDDGIPLIGVILQPEVYLPLIESETCIGRIVWAVRGSGAHVSRTEFRDGRLHRQSARSLKKLFTPETRTYVACVPMSTKMTSDEAERARRVWESGIIAVTTGAGGAGANGLMTIFGGQHVYANFGAGDDLDLIPPQVIAEEAGVTVWDRNRNSPVWHAKKQPVIFAPSPAIAERFLQAAGL